VLPAIQREFVWKPEQIEKLFDSLMQGYPFVQDFIRTAAAPASDWLEKAWSGAEQRGLDKLAPAEIDVEIQAGVRDL
jgi:hypothetical protein